MSEALAKLRARADPTRLEGMARFGINPDARLGLSMPELRQLGKELGRDHALALALYKTGSPDARILASLVAEPGRLTNAQMEQWVTAFDSWDVCDQVCMNLFEKSPAAWNKVREWSEREPEFVKRAAFALLACLAWHDKSASDKQFVELLPVVVAGASDERNYVKKAVSWALRNIGKRNAALNTAAVRTARGLRQSESRSARWVGTDALKELEGAPVKSRLGKVERA